MELGKVWTRLGDHGLRHQSQEYMRRKKDSGVDTCSLNGPPKAGL